MDFVWGRFSTCLCRVSKPGRLRTDPISSDGRPYNQFYFCLRVIKRGTDYSVWLQSAPSEPKAQRRADHRGTYSTLARDDQFF
jgi:hypothetical protein